MNVATIWLLIGLGILIIAGLAIYAWRLWREVKRREAFKREEGERANEQCLSSLGVIARAMLDDQVDLTEGSLRCKVLLEIIDPALLERDAFRAFGEVHARTTHLHTHSARQALSPAERRDEDRQRLAVESELEDALRDAARAVLDFRSRWSPGLQ